MPMYQLLAIKLSRGFDYSLSKQFCFFQPAASPEKLLAPLEGLGRISNSVINSKTPLLWRHIKTCTSLAKKCQGTLPNTLKPSKRIILGFVETRFGDSKRSQKPVWWSRHGKSSMTVCIDHENIVEQFYSRLDFQKIHLQWFYFISSSN